MRAMRSHEEELEDQLLDLRLGELSFGEALGFLGEEGAIPVSLASVIRVQARDGGWQIGS